MKKLLLSLALVLCPLMLTAQDAQKIGIVDTQTIFTSMPETKAAQSQLDELAGKYENEVATMESELKKQYEDYEKEAANLTDAMKVRKQQDLEELQRRILTHRQVAAQDLQKKQMELLAPIQTKIHEAINKVGSENGFAYILEASQLLYVGSNGQDVTALVRSKLGL